jgi:acetoacetyl-CoA synthetase
MLSTLIFTCLCRIEVAVKQIISGLDVKTNASVANPEALEWFKDWAGKQ